MISRAGATLRIPNLIITDFEFEPYDEDNKRIHPVLGTPEVRNINEIDWNALKGRTLQEWSNVCQEHYDMVVKLGNNSTPEPSRLARSRKSKLGSSR